MRTSSRSMAAFEAWWELVQQSVEHMRASLPEELRLSMQLVVRRLNGKDVIVHIQARGPQTVVGDGALEAPDAVVHVNETALAQLLVADVPPRNPFRVRGDARGFARFFNHL